MDEPTSPEEAVDCNSTPDLEWYWFGLIIAVFLLFCIGTISFSTYAVMMFTNEFSLLSLALITAASISIIALILNAINSKKLSKASPAFYTIVFLGILGYGIRQIYVFIEPSISKYAIPFIIQKGLAPEVYTASALIILIISCVLYRVRCKNRLFYGSIELLFGVGNVLWSSRQYLDGFISNAPTAIWLGDGQSYQAGFQLLAGIYIIIRGLSNIEDGLKTNKPNLDVLPRIWSWLFYR